MKAAIYARYRTDKHREGVDMVLVKYKQDRKGRRK